MANVENDISLKLLDISKFTTKIKALDEDLKNLDQEIRDKVTWTFAFCELKKCNVVNFALPHLNTFHDMPQFRRKCIFNLKFDPAISFRMT